MTPSSEKVSVEEVERRRSRMDEGNELNIWRAYDSLKLEPTERENVSWAAKNAAFAPSDPDPFKMKSNAQNNCGQIGNKEDHTEGGVSLMENTAIERGIENHGIEKEEELVNITRKSEEAVPATDNTSTNKSTYN